MRDELIRRKEIVAVWTGKRHVVIGAKTETDMKILISAEKPIIPLYIDSLPTVIQFIGKIKALQTRMEKWRPAPPGISIGHRDITAGTLGGVYMLNNEPMILSNNHVLANSNAGQIDDPVYQPGPYDISNPTPPIPPIPPCPFANMAATLPNLAAKLFKSSWRLFPRKIQEIDPEYQLATLWDFYPIDFSGGYNYIDAALARPLDPGLVTNKILELGYASGFGKAELGMNVIKSGRTTAVTQNIINGIDGLIKVSYGDNREAIFDKQIITGKMLDGGDSGSNVLEESSMKVIGLGFAGSDTISIINSIEFVLNKWPALKIV